MIFPECHQDAYELIEKASKELYPAYVLKANSESRVDKMCALVDKLVSEIDCKKFIIEMDAPKMELVFILVFGYFEMEDTSNPFYKAIKKFDTFSFSKYDDKYMQIKLHAKNLWEENVDGQ